ncbi:response regulator [Nitrospirota bacterium]
MKKTILLVDDSPAIRAILSLSLMKTGYEVITAISRMNAIEKLSSSAVDIVITDLYIHEGEGLELIRELRSSDTYKSIPIIMLTAGANNSYIKSVQSAGANAMMFKPVDHDLLNDTIISCLVN